ncbi:MAG: carbon storage regulator [Oscillospiraceae bacterium]|nr:carbon storage regulator [Oscillospiraceae bacterium]MDE6933715.1 carbon storage regulator [Oscillospiraceae bacterium]
MLFLQLKSGEYLTIGEDIAIQVFQETSDRIRVAVTAPRDMTILRGEVRERTGANRPGTIIPTPVSPG